MSELRLWFHWKLARLDGARERRFVALAAALLFAALTLGPQALHVVDAAVNPTLLNVDSLGDVPLANPVRFRATAQNVVFDQLKFTVTSTDNVIFPIAGHLAAATDPTRWISDDFVGEPGKAYTVYASGFSVTSGPVESPTLTFTIADPNNTSGSGTSGSGTSGSGTSSGPSGTAELVSVIAFPGTEPRVEAKGRQVGFVADSGFFRVQSVTGPSYLKEFSAARSGTDAWTANFAPPSDALYRVTFVAVADGTPRESLPQEVLVPKADAPAESTQTPTQQTEPQQQLTPTLNLLLPNEGSESFSPVPIVARVTNATATAMKFDVLDPAGVTRTLDGSVSATGDWTAMFSGNAGQYGVRARALLIGGSALGTPTARSFRILASATSTPPTETQDSSTTSTSTPVVTDPVAVDLYAPADGALPFPGPVPLSGRVRNGLPDRVVAVVIGPNGAETIVIATKTQTGDFWNAVFEGPDGEYRFRMRATVAGKDTFSPERRFSIKRPVTTTTPLPEPTAPAPTPTASTTVTAPTPPPPPPPPTGALQPISATGTNVATTTTSVPAAVPPELAEECRAAGILPARCAEWLRAKYQNRDCLDAGAVTREACVEILTRRNLPADDSQLIGLVSRQELAQVREDAKRVEGTPVRPDQLPASVAALLPPQKDPEARLRILAVANAKDDSSPAIVVIDTDGDGLPDDLERRFGTDPRVADTDGDGFSDGDEVKNGYDPLGPGKLEKPARGVEKALLEGLPLEEPRGEDALKDESFTIEAAPAKDEEDEDVIRLSGVAAPNSVVTVFVYSYLPIVVTTTTDENGNWTYDFGSKLAEGRHDAYVSVNDDTGKLVASSSPLAFFVKEAQAVTEEDFLGPDVNVEETTSTFSRWFVFGGVALVALALILVIAIIRQTRKDPAAATGENL